MRRSKDRNTTYFGGHLFYIFFRIFLAFEPGIKNSKVDERNVLENQGSADEVTAVYQNLSFIILDFTVYN